VSGITDATSLIVDLPPGTPGFQARLIHSVRALSINGVKLYNILRITWALESSFSTSTVVCIVIAVLLR
jgi:hypothetical protein